MFMATFKITPREAQVIYMHCIKGIPPKEIARLLGISPRTARAYIESVKDRLDCSTKAQLGSVIQQMVDAGTIDFSLIPVPDEPPVSVVSDTADQMTLMETR